MHSPVQSLSDEEAGLLEERHSILGHKVVYGDLLNRLRKVKSSLHEQSSLLIDFFDAPMGERNRVGYGGEVPVRDCDIDSMN